jgi:hypothetical protein
METNQLEKQFEMWKRLLFMLIGASITFVAIALGTIVYGTDWPGFGNYTGGIWTAIQFLSTLPGFHLLWGRHWQSIPLSSRLNTIFGYFAVSWLSLLSLGLIMSMPPATDYYILLVGGAIVITIAYIWTLKRTSLPRDEMFP